MTRALALAAQGDFSVRPNPSVGALLVREGQVLAEGRTGPCGGAHAEAQALSALRAQGGDPRGATLYLTLEPCGPFPGKRTPPCVEAVLDAGISRLVVASEDPHPAMRGASLARLRAAGVRVEQGLCDAEARRGIAPFRKWVTTGLPYVTGKWAMSLDGKIAAASGHSQWISGPTSRERVHVLRGEVDAILVGIGTALADDPRLTRRGVPGGDPLRIVLDSQARLPPSARLLSEPGSPVLLAHSEDAPQARLEALRGAGAECLALPSLAAGGLDPRALLKALALREVQHLLVEGGGQVLASFLEAGSLDRVWCFVAPLLIGGQGAPSPLAGLGVERVDEAPRCAHLTQERLGEDLLLIGELVPY